MATRQSHLPHLHKSSISIPIDNESTSSQKHQRSASNIFFNASTPISELKKINEESTIAELYTHWDQTQKTLIQWASASPSPQKPSPCKSPVKIAKYPFLLTPPPGFEAIKPTFPLSDISTESEISPTSHLRSLCKVSLNDVKLLPLPNKFGLIKREKRGTFSEELVSTERYCGEIKFYQLKKRFGFISLDLDKSDIFLCEDDLVLSGISIKKFKEAVFKKELQRFSFYIKYYQENGAEKRKAIEIKCLNDID